MLDAVAVLGSMQKGCHKGTALRFLVPFYISPMSHQAYSFSNNTSPKAAPLASLTRLTMNLGDILCPLPHPPPYETLEKFPEQEHRDPP